MPIAVTCPQGHTWDLPNGEGRGRAVCPVCGAVVPLVPAEEAYAEPTGIRAFVQRHPTLTLIVALALAISALTVSFALYRVQRARQGPASSGPQLSAAEARDRGVDLCNQGDVNVGLLWLAHGLRIAPADDANLQSSIRMHLAGWARRSPMPRATLQHDDMVTAVAFSPESKTILTGSRDNMARLWDAATGKPQVPPLLHGDIVRAVAFSPDGKTVLTGSDDNTARLWDAATGQPRGQPMPHQDTVHGVAFSPDGRLVATASDDRTARVWNAATGMPIGEPLRHPDGVWLAIYRADSKVLLTASLDGSAYLWDISTEKLIGQPLRHPAMAMAGPVMPGQTGESERVSQVPTLRAAAFSPDGKLVVTAGDDRTARLWNAGTGEAVGIPMAHSEWVQAVAFSPDGKRLLTGCWDGTAQQWDVATQQALGPPVAHRPWVPLVAYRPDGTIFATGSDQKFGPRGEVRLWETDTRQPVGPTLLHLGRLSGIAFSPDGKLLVTGSWDRTAKVWDLAPVDATVERILLWAQVNAGMELTADGTPRKLDPNTLAERRRRLQELGGPPTS